ncbi:MAG: HD domain-containing protein [Bacteroidales bacterium]|nr:HD domain-containing protein [Bacteroidales bacterium]MBD5205723.1 HD domain-containing protein [Bacteroidales bacterium]MBD5222467.1 HD domain-containing protein [Bacteroidales bacterium]
MGREVYVVGGYVRDLFLNRQSKDIDFVTVGSGIELAEKVAEALGRSKGLSVYATYGTAQIKSGDLELEFVGARRESYHRESRNPIVEDGTIEDDQNRRDFTINAMAICLNSERFGELVDPFGGLADLHKKEIRTPLDPDITFSDDPLRMMRAIRFATQLEFTIVPETFEAIVRNRKRIEIITRERINDELSKIIRSPRPSIGFKLLDKAGLLELIFPRLCDLKGVEIMEGKGHKDNFNHTLQVLDQVAEKSDNEWLRWAALLHDIGKPATKRYDEKLGWTFHNHNYIGEKMIPRMFREMKFPLNEKMKYVAKLVGLHMRPQSVGEEGVSDSGVRRLITDAGEDLEDLMLLAEADITSKNPVKVRRQLQGFARLRERMGEISDADALRTWTNPINGNEIMKHFNLSPGPEISLIKEAVKEAILDGRIPYDHDAAWEFVIKEGPGILNNNLKH